MDKRKSKLNVCISLMFKLSTAIMVIVVKRYLIQICGNEVNGLNAMYLSIISFLAVAELGVGSAITFCMYAPIVEGKQDEVSALYQLFRRLYTLVGAVILIGGLAILPFLRYFARDYAQLDVNLQLTFFLMLCSVVLTYAFGANTALINAHKNNYIVTAINSGGILLQYVLQIIVLVTTHSFTGYLVCRIVAALVQWGVTEIVTRKKYADILRNQQRINKETGKRVSNHVRAMFMHKIGTLLVSSSNSVIISTFVGVAALGEYSNYTAILTSVMGIVTAALASLTSVWGHLYAKESKTVAKAYNEAFHMLNFVIGVVVHLGFYAIADNLIAILFSGALVADKSIPFVITLNGFVAFMRHNTLTFRDATGTFYHDRWKPLAEGIVNFLLSVFLVKRIGVTGAIAATIVTNLVICHVVEPYVLYKNAFSASPRSYYIRNYGMILVFMAALLAVDRVMRTLDNLWMELLVNGFLSVGVSLGACAVVMLINIDVCKRTVKLLKE